MVDKTLTKLIISQREKALQEAGLSEVDENGQQNKEYFSELEAARELAETQSKYKSYRHIFEQFGQHVINKDYDKFKMAELEREAFMETLCNSGEYWHIDLGEDGYKPKFLDSADVFKHTSKNIKYVADGDYVGWFEEMTAGDIINEFGRDLTKEQFDLLKQTLESYSNTLQNGGGTSLVAHELGFPGAYYDTSKPYPEGRMNRPMADYWRGENLEAIANNFQNLPSSSVAGIFNNGSTSFSSPKMFRVM